MFLFFVWIHNWKISRHNRECLQLGSILKMQLEWNSNIFPLFDCFLFQLKQTNEKWMQRTVYGCFCWPIQTDLKWTCSAHKSIVYREFNNRSFIFFSSLFNSQWVGLFRTIQSTLSHFKRIFFFIHFVGR